MKNVYVHTEILLTLVIFEQFETLITVFSSQLKVSILISLKK